MVSDITYIREAVDPEYRYIHHLPGEHSRNFGEMEVDIIVGGEYPSLMVQLIRSIYGTFLPLNTVLIPIYTRASALQAGLNFLSIYISSMHNRRLA